MILVDFGQEGEAWEREAETLRAYQELVLSSVGPRNGRLKLLGARESSQGLVLTNSARLLVRRLYRLKDLRRTDEEKQDATGLERLFGFTKWKFELVHGALETAHFGQHYDSGLFLVHLVNEFQLRQCDKALVEGSLQYLVEHLTDEVRRVRTGAVRSLVVVGLDLEDTGFFVDLLGTQLASKCLFKQLGRAERRAFIDILVRAGVRSFDGTSNARYFARIVHMFNVSALGRLSDSRAFDGLLVELDKSQRLGFVQSLARMRSRSSSGLRCVLFEASLSGDFESISSADSALRFAVETDETAQSTWLLGRLLDICRHLVEQLRVDVLLCQKVVHPSAKAFLDAQGVLVVDRLSLELVAPLSELTGCKVLDSWWNVNQIGVDSLGSLASVELVDYLNGAYLHLKNQDRSSQTQTLVVAVPSASHLSEAQYLVRVAEKTFQRALLNGAALVGGPCFYSYSMCAIWKHLSTVNASSLRRAALVRQADQIRLVFARFLTQLLDRSSLDEHSLDLTTGHLFHAAKPACHCDLVPRRLTSALKPLAELACDSVEFDGLLTAAAPSSGRARLLDCLESRSNALRVARDLLAAIGEIGVFLHD